MAKKDIITSQKEDFSAWYNDVVRLAELADYGPVKGTMIIKPYGYAIWENIQRIFDAEIKKEGVLNAYFPMFIPESFLKKEAAHVEGFSPELAVVTYAGGEKLEEPVVVRPTSETIMYHTFSKWISSYRDLPLKINQWCNVVRWEKRTKPFIRTSEFLWQEGHTVFATEKEVEEETFQRICNYEKFFKEFLSLPSFVGKKSESEKFAGAKYTTSIEILLKDGKALQSATSHNLGQNFSKAFDIQFENRDGKREFVWQSSWGISTRVIGGLILMHGDDKGLVLPPQIAPIQVAIIPIYKSDEEKKLGLKTVDDLVAGFGDGVRFKIDDRENLTYGWKSTEWEIKGVPVRIEIGPKDIEKDSVTLVRRDEDGKNQIAIKDIEISKLLQEIQDNLYKKALAFKEENTYTVENFEQFTKDVESKRGFYFAPWCDDSACEKAIQEKTTATTRNIPLENNKPKEGVKCFHCGKDAKKMVYFAKAY